MKDNKNTVKIHVKYIGSEELVHVENGVANVNCTRTKNSEITELISYIKTMTGHEFEPCDWRPLSQGGFNIEPVKNVKNTSLQHKQIEDIQKLNGIESVEPNGVTRLLVKIK